MKEDGYALPYEREAFKVLDDVINAEDAGVCAMDFDTNRILFANDKMADYIDDPDIARIIGEGCPENKHADENGTYPSYNRENLLDSDGNPLPTSIREEYIENMDIWLKIIDQAIKWINGSMIRIVTFYDITESKKIRKQLTELKIKDRILGLKNDVSLEKDILEASVKPSLILFQVLSMQKIKEFHGWKKGDYLLCTIRDAILSKEVPNSELYRINGDKFCLTVTGISRAGLRQIARDMSDMFAGIWNVEYEGMMLKAFNDIAIAIIPAKYIQGNESVLNMSARMLAKAKQVKKSVVYNKKMDKAYQDHLNLEWDLIKCVHENMLGFDIFYQPIVKSGNTRWCGLEALCRWESPELGNISPSVFIPEAERLELIETLGLWVLETAVSKCKSWKLDLCDSFVLNVNVSAVQFQNEALAGEIICILEKYNFPGEKLCIEITESTSVTFLDQSLCTIEQLRGHNILVALDDFGTGYSSFSRLQSMPVDIVKIERMFVSDIENNEYHRYLFQAMADLAHTANIKLVAEGVERKRQMNILVQDGADYLQGFLFSKPLPPREIENKLIRFYRQPPSMEKNYYPIGNSSIEYDVI